MNIYQEILDAEQRIRPYILTTPLIESRELSKMINGKVYLKLENEQYTGSFKARGSLNKLLSLDEEERKRGVITASTGNHALGFARGLEITGIKGTVYLPENASKSKVSALGNYPVKLAFYGWNSLSAEEFAKSQAKAKGMVWVSPYNDPQVIGGQGTIAVELVNQLNEFDDILITIGGGGLISGIGTYLKDFDSNINIIGTLPENSPEMSLSLEAGKVIILEESLETLSDGSAGGVEEGSITFPICQQVVDETILVTENEIAGAIKFVAHQHHKIIEGSAGVAVASLLKEKERFLGRTVVIVLCGANIDIDKYRKII